MHTSYFARSGKHPNAVAICGKRPDFYHGRMYQKLAPTWSIFSEWKQSGDNGLFVKRYYQEVLDKLNPEQTYLELGDDAIIICYEGKGKFCHRKLVSNWFLLTIGVEVPEL